MPKIYESPDGGTTIYVREAGSTERCRVIINQDGEERTFIEEPVDKVSHRRLHSDLDAL
tara:strand:- start:42 stop:218 length:177 start_codon:yes stop_codon:yes gene_type:complete